jgi:hypothetical protein
VARELERPQTKAPGRYRLAVVVIAGALLIGLAAGAINYLSSSLVIGPEWRAGTEELRERGAQVYFESCAGFAEPRFWPECSGDAGENRTRGASALVAFCTGRDRGNRFFGPSDCLSEDRPAFALVAGPDPEDVTVGIIAAASALSALGLLALLSRAGGYGVGPRSAPMRE